MKRALVCVAVVLPISARLTVAQNDTFLQKIPWGANAVMAIDIDALKQTELARKEGWGADNSPTNVGRPIVLPTDAHRVIVAALLDCGNELTPIWNLALLQMVEPLSMRSIARAEGGYVDRINDTDTAWTPSEAYFVGLDSDTIGIMAPGNRQLISRWITLCKKNRQTELSEYLQSAVGQASPTTQIVLALDLRNALPPHKLRESLENSHVLRSSERKVDELMPLIAGIRGLTLQITVTTRARGVLQVDFSESTKPFVNFAQSLVLEAFQKADASLRDLESWKTRLEGNAIVMEGDLTDDGLRRLGSLVQIPTTKFATVDAGAVGKPVSPGDAGKVSLTYFKSITTLIDDLRKTLGDTRDNHAVWMERYGRKIDALPILNVDEDLLAYGANVAETFRTMALAKRASGVRSGVRKSSIYGSYQYSGYRAAGYGYRYGYGSVRSSESVRHQITREEQAAATKVRFESWKEIEDATAQVRREMTQRYQIEF